MSKRQRQPERPPTRRPPDLAPLLGPEPPAEPYATEPTEQGNQYVIPGCEKDRSRGPQQGDLF